MGGASLNIHQRVAEAAHARRELEEAPTSQRHATGGGCENLTFVSAEQREREQQQLESHTGGARPCENKLPAF